ncbi:Hpt domain-containing protein [Parendozoicomonas haliclonae]|uniref:Sensor protein TorS n=1 Tax=Parendozoicomonas haliclonae TaxID=1960125 RepID=A0A1X7AHW2_9GAMM|nr:Hpt domain-containing protein [Parendozoicomonas haliclonae]SMA43682.1 Sensor protein TorS [Parendozoicomonas haliclonae]
MEPVDFSVLDEFKELMGDEGEDEVRDLVALYLEDGPVQLEAMRSSLSSGDVETLKRAAHSFKSSCGNIGAIRLQGTCSELEQKAASGELGADCQTLITQAESSFAEVKAALGSYLAS